MCVCSLEIEDCRQVWLRHSVGTGNCAHYIKMMLYNDIRFEIGLV